MLQHSCGGYIRSYARLVHIPEEELLPGLEKQAPLRAAKVAPMQSFSLGKRRKKRDGWLMTFTRLVLFVVIGLSGAWWWQDHKARRKITTMADQSSAELNNNQSQSVPLDTSTTTDQGYGDHADITCGYHRNQHANTCRNCPAPAVDPQQNAVVPPSQANVDTAATPAPAATTTPDGAAPLPTDQAGVTTPAVDPNALVMNFTADCWLEVTDATGKNCLAVCSVKTVI